MSDNSVIFITGGTGSFGQAFVKEAVKHDIKAIRIYSRNERLQWQMKQEFKDERIRWMIGDIRDRDRLEVCLYGCDYIVHAAALKHVSTGQYNPQEVIKTNCQGSINVVDIAKKVGVKKVLGISSDKAVEPSCLYGSTKLIMETLFMDSNRWAMPDTKLSCLRSGNFIESYGNVFEAWEKQCESGEVTLTDSNMTRYFIPIDEVARLAFNLLEIMEGKEIFVPKMKEYKIEDLLLAGLARHPAKVKITGKGDGEKLREKLFNDSEHPIDCGDYYVIKEG